jgi:L-lactate dehydrogenase complex protein LldG
MTQTMEHLAERYHNDPSNFPTNICLISGPSRTADIELVTVDGAHGPIQVTYVLVNR